MPGAMPAMNISPTDAPVTTLYIIIVTLGGIKAAMLAAEIISPSTLDSLYPDSSIIGRIVLPIATTVACVEPEIAPNNVQVPAIVTPKPP